MAGTSASVGEGPPYDEVSGERKSGSRGREKGCSGGISLSKVRDVDANWIEVGDGGLWGDSGLSILQCSVYEEGKEEGGRGE
jgi:hypothetical protein